jgi:hypothetical protein
MTTPHLSDLQLIFAHPLNEKPYNQLRYKKTNHHGIHLYEVFDQTGQITGDVCGPYKALWKALKIHGGKCFYNKCTIPQILDNPHRDHLNPNGNDELHNLVISCGNCNVTKSNGPIVQFDGQASLGYLLSLQDRLTQLGKAFAIK